MIWLKIVGMLKSKLLIEEKMLYNGSRGGCCGNGIVKDNGYGQE